MKKREKADIKTRNLRVILTEKNKVDPVRKFIVKINDARSAPPFSELNHRRKDLDRQTNGSWPIKRSNRAITFMNSKDNANMVKAIMNFGLGSILWIGLVLFVNLNPSNSLRDKLF